MAGERGSDLFDFANMTDLEMREVIVEQLREYPNLDASSINVRVSDGTVALTGQVGTDAEFQVAEAVLDDVLGIDDYSNELIVSELHRAEAPDGAGEAAARRRDVDDETGGSDRHQSDTADHLTEDVESQTYGTHDVSEAIRDGAPYVPPDHITGDGYDSKEDH
jgi:hypothetical protein